MAVWAQKLEQNCIGGQEHVEKKREQKNQELVRESCSPQGPALTSTVIPTFLPFLNKVIRLWNLLETDSWLRPESSWSKAFTDISVCIRNLCFYQYNHRDSNDLTSHIIYISPCPFNFSFPLLSFQAVCILNAVIAMYTSFFLIYSSPAFSSILWQITLHRITYRCFFLDLFSNI